jgi:Zinc finger, C3HC4 type (RING finger)
MCESVYEIVLKLPKQDIKVKSVFRIQPLMIPKVLEIDGMLNLNYYSCVYSNHIDNNLIALIEQDEIPKYSSILLEIISYLKSHQKILNISSDLHPDYMLFLIPFNNSNILGLYAFKIIEVLGYSLESYIQYIANIKSAKNLLSDLYKNFESETESLSFEVSELVDKSSQLEKHCYQVTEQIKDLKTQICSLANEFEIYHAEFKDYECLNCRSNLKDILYLPCGHIALCHSCLKSDHKITVDLPIIENSFMCLVCNKSVTQAIRYTFN